MKPEQHYNLVVDFFVPDSDNNLDLGNFMVNIDALAKDNTSLVRASRPAILMYKSPLFRSWNMYWKLTSLLFGLSLESQQFTVRLVEDYEEKQATPVDRILVSISTDKLQTYATNLRIETHFQGLSYFMFHWWLTTAAFFISIFMLVETLFVSSFWRVIQALMSADLDDEEETPRVVTSEQLLDMVGSPEQRDADLINDAISGRRASQRGASDASGRYMGRDLHGQNGDQVQPTSSSSSSSTDSSEEEGNEDDGRDGIHDIGSGYRSSAHDAGLADPSLPYGGGRAMYGGINPAQFGPSGSGSAPMLGRIGGGAGGGLGPGATGDSFTANLTGSTLSQPYAPPANPAYGSLFSSPYGSSYPRSAAATGGTSLAHPGMPPAVQPTLSGMGGTSMAAQPSLHQQQQQQQQPAWSLSSSQQTTTTVESDAALAAVVPSSSDSLPVAAMDESLELQDMEASDDGASLVPSQRSASAPLEQPAESPNDSPSPAHDQPKDA
ncbi:putative adipose-regulatory protein-domain-containing protein [Entophlyctis helioformis]|nr:putative adipose-regulatory protein-domain-containing protein [Entophlyctis helioformis]